MLTLDPIGYHDDVPEILAPAFDVVPIQWDVFEQAARADVLGLVEIKDGGQPVMLAALNQAVDLYGPTGTIVAARGALPGRDLTAETLPMFEAGFRGDGMQWCRVVTARPGLQHKLMARGYRALGTIYLKGLGH